MPIADLVLEGGGAKGPGLAGAVTALVDRSDPYEFHRIAGTSAGAIAAALLAAGMSPDELASFAKGLDFADLRDEPRRFRHARRAGEAAGLLFHEGMFLGDVLHRMVSDKLAELGVRTWADLKQDDPESGLPPDRRYKLVVIVSDVSRGRMLRLPWDYRTLLGVDPDEQLVADAVRASASLPFFFRPFRMAADPAVAGHDEIVCTDGGMLSNYPIDIFDRNDGKPARWPTLGVKLSARHSITAAAEWKPDATTFELAKAILLTMEIAHDRVHIDDPSFSSRTIFVDTTGYSRTGLDIGPDDRLKLFRNGLASGRKFLQTWDWEAWKRGDFDALLTADD